MKSYVSSDTEKRIEAAKLAAKSDGYEYLFYVLFKNGEDMCVGLHEEELVTDKDERKTKQALGGIARSSMMFLLHSEICWNQLYRL